eukprot:1620433-Prymnesium_polylepis.1
MSTTARAVDCSRARCCVEKSMLSLENLCVMASVSLKVNATSSKASPSPAPYSSVLCTSATLVYPQSSCKVLTITRAFSVEDGMVLRKKGYLLPSPNEGLLDDGEMIGAWEPAATCAAVEEASEQPAPMIALTPSPWNADCVSDSAAVNAAEASHLPSRKEARSVVFGSKWSNTPSFLSLISRRA